MTKFTTWGAKPEDFIQHFNETSEKPFDLKGLNPVDFVRGLPAVFSVIMTTMGPQLYIPVSSREPVSSQGFSGRSASSSSLPKIKMPAATDVIVMLTKINKQLADRELSLDDYLGHVERANGEGPTRYLKERYPKTNDLMRFITRNSSLQNPVEITQLGRLRINGRQQEPEASSNDIDYRNSNRPREAERERYSYIDDFPYSTAFKHIEISNQKEVDAAIGSFTADREIQFYFTTAYEVDQRDVLLNRINSDLSRKPDGRLRQVYKGMPCLAPDDCPNSNKYQRAVVVKELDTNKVEVLFVDNGSICEAAIGELREISTELLSDRVYSHPAIVGLIRPCNGKPIFQIHIAQNLAAHDGDVVRIKILRYSNSYHVVDLGSLVTPLIERGLVERDATRTGAMASIEASSTAPSYSIRVEMVPNMNNIFIVTRNTARGRDILVPTACLSKMLGLTLDSLLEDLERETFITLSNDRLVKEENDGELYLQLSRRNCPLLSPEKAIILIPIESVVPLLRAHEGAKTLKETLACAKSTYKFLVNLFAEYKDQPQEQS